MKNFALKNLLKNKKIFITGASGKLGSMMSYNLGLLGAELILTDFSNKNSEKLINKLRNKKRIKFKFYYCDLEDQLEREILIKKINLDYRTVDIVINNAAFVGKNKLEGWNEKFEKQAITTFRRALDVNLVAPFHIIQLLSRLLNRSKNPSIINISSIYGILGPKWDLYKDVKMSNPAAYAASKGGLIQLTRWLSTTLSPKIRVNSIILGGVKDKQAQSFIKKYQNQVPLGRMADEDDIIGAIIFLSSNMSSYINGQCIKVDGGWSAW